MKELFRNRRLFATWALIGLFLVPACGKSAKKKGDGDTGTEDGGTEMVDDTAVDVGEQAARERELQQQFAATMYSRRYEQAVQIAESGQQDVADDEEWQSFGVFGLIQGDEQEADKVLQLGASKDGVVAGNYYDTLTDTTMPITGSVDQKSQRVAWTVGDNSTVVYETGVGDLTKDELTVLIHFGNEKGQQWTMIRLEEPDDAAEGGK